MRIQQLSSAIPGNEYSTEELIDGFRCRLPEGVRLNILNLGVAKRSFINSGVIGLRSEAVLDEKVFVDLCTGACGNALGAMGLSARDVGYFIAAYDVSPVLSPGLSQLLVRRIGFDPYVKHVNVQGFASTAFPKALQLAEDHLGRNPEERVLICVSGVSSYWFRNQVRGLKDVMEVSEANEIGDGIKRQMELRKWVATMQYFLFGDGVVAAIVSNDGDGVSVVKTVEVTNVREEDYLAGYARLAALEEPFRFGFFSHLGREIPNFGVEYTRLALERLLGDGLRSTVKASRRWAVHTGSQKILDALARHHGVDAEKLKESRDVLREHGNLSGASLPFILERIVRDVGLSKGDILLMLGYGWGFSASASLLEV